MATDYLGPYRSKAVPWRDRLLLPASVALSLLDDCEEKDVRLSDCEAFEAMHDGSIRSLADEGLDASGKEYWDYSVEELCEVFRDHIRLRSRMLFELS
jgi:hypothetical protein